MNDLDQLRMRARELVDLLNDYTKAYDEGNPKISDKEWDDLYFELQDIESTLSESYIDSPTQSISFEVVNGLNKITHSHPMLSLNKTKDANDLTAFLGDQFGVLMGKMDGLTVSLTYENTYLVRAETRGNGIVGEDILHNAKVIPTIPNRINNTNKCVIDGEVICTYENFENFKDEYANPRNFAAGSIRLLDSQECKNRYLTFIAWDWIEGSEEKTLAGKLIKLGQLGFFTVPAILVNKDNLKEKIDFLKNNITYPIDGLVLKYNSCAYYDAQGKTEHHFKGGIAYKFYDEEFETTLKTIEWTMGRTGELTPVAIFEPVNDGVSTITRASLHNVSIMAETMYYPFIGQQIKVAKMNQIIPQVVWAEKRNFDNLYDIETLSCTIPDICPICGQPLTIHTSDTGIETLWCDNKDCMGKSINQIDHFCGKTGLDIKGLSKKTLEKLLDWKWIATYEDIFELAAHRQEWIKKDGFGSTSVDKILKNIAEACDEVPLDKYLCAIGIPLIGPSNAKALAKNIDTWGNFRTKVYEKFDFAKLDTFGEEKEKAILDFDYLTADIVADRYLNFKNDLYATHGILDGLTFVITGSLNNYSNRDELKTFIENNGGKVAGSISSRTSYLINNNIESTTGKNKRAKELNIPIINEEQFNKLFEK